MHHNVADNPTRDGNNSCIAPESLGVTQLRRLRLDGRGICIAHLDTGVATRSCLSERVGSFRDFDRFGCTVASQPFDSGSHGTQTAGLICGGTVDGNSFGVAPRTSLCSGVVIEGGDVLVRVLKGMDWTLTTGARVLTMPMGVPGWNPVFETMISVLRSAGTLPVLPIGNAVAGKSCSPGNYQKVLSVGAVDQAGNVAPFSGSLNVANGVRCLKPDILAPGVDVLTIDTDGQLTRASGTSMASAYVAGIAALLFQARPSATVDEVEQALVSTATPVRESQSHRVRAGIVAPASALQHLLHAPPLDKSASDSDSRPIGFDSGEQKFIDQRLRDQLTGATDNRTMRGIFVLREDARNEHEPRTVEPIIEQISNCLGETPTEVQSLPHARLAIVSASAAFIETLTEHDQIAVASAADVHTAIL